MDGDFIPVAAAVDIAVDHCRPFEVRGLRIVIAHLANGWHAVENRCSHANSVLNTSKIYRGCQIACPVHGARFDLRTGAAKSPPAFTPLAVYPVRIRDGVVEIAMPRTEAPLRSVPR